MPVYVICLVTTVLVRNCLSKALKNVRFYEFIYLALKKYIAKILSPFKVILVSIEGIFFS
jgi:hypothetical protein